jgi:DNA-binding NarL/FixJ family response regulator
MDKRVVLADHHCHVLWALWTAMQEEPGIMVVGEASDAVSLVSQAKALKLDLILPEWELRAGRLPNYRSSWARCTPGPKLRSSANGRNWKNSYFRLVQMPLSVKPEGRKVCWRCCAAWCSSEGPNRP